MNIINLLLTTTLILSHLGFKSNPDHLGSTSVMTDDSGAQVKYLEYQPYGETKVEEGSLAVRKKFTGSALTEIYFQEEK